MTETIVINHPVRVTKQFLGVEPGFPEGEVYLSLPVVRMAIMMLVARNVPKFDDGMYHGDIHLFGMQDLLNGVASHEVKSGDVHLERIQTKPGQNELWIFGGVRWEVSPVRKRCALYGPKSDPDNVVLIDLVKEKQ